MSHSSTVEVNLERRARGRKRLITWFECYRLVRTLKTVEIARTSHGVQHFMITGSKWASDTRLLLTDSSECGLPLTSLLFHCDFYCAFSEKHEDVSARQKEIRAGSGAGDRHQSAALWSFCVSRLLVFGYIYMHRYAICTCTLHLAITRVTC